MISLAMLSLIEINKQQEENRREREEIKKQRDRMSKTNLSGSLKGLCRPCFGHLDKLSING
jgi:hypothetical protein